MKVLMCLVLLMLPLTLSGCVLAVGNEGEKVQPADPRVDDLERRMVVIEGRLGIPTPPAVEDPADPAN